MYKYPEIAPQVKPTEEVIIVDEQKEDDQYLLAKLIYSEARGESLEGQIAVGAVVMNRVEATGGTIEEVIMAKNQFSNVTGMVPNEENLEAAKRAIDGEDPTGGAVYFYNPDKCQSKFHESREITKIIGHHVFTI